MVRNIRKVAVLMSGGVDSSVAVLLLKKQGYKVIGIFLKFWVDSAEACKIRENKCCGEQARSDARKIAQILDVPLYTLNFEDYFKEKVVNDFLSNYARGKTPNPCVRCNKFIKFGEVLKKARALGCDYVATGHYALIKKNKRYKLIRGRDKIKDQSYFLYNLKQKDLGRILLPIGQYKKEEVRQIAKKNKLPVFEKKDSQGICFIPGQEVSFFLKRYLKSKKGKIVNQNNDVVGFHGGLPFFTLGQRQGMDIKDGKGPYYVTSFDFKKNVLKVTSDLRDKKLFRTVIFLKGVSWVVPKLPKMPFQALVKYRHPQEPEPAVVYKKANRIFIEFKKPQRALAQGQSAVIYREKEVLGGGVIGY